MVVREGTETPDRARKTPMFKEAWVAEYWGIDLTKCWRTLGTFMTSDDAYRYLTDAIGRTHLQYRVRPVTVPGDTPLAPYRSFDPSAPVTFKPALTSYFPKVQKFPSPYDF